LNLTSPQQSSIFHTVRDFDCWRGLAFSEKYSCSVQALSDGRVKLELDIICFAVSPAVARELSECLNDALAIQIDDDSQFEFRRQQQVLKVTILDGRKGLRYEAEGEVDITSASPDFFGDSDNGNARIAVYTIPGGGYEFDFDFMCFSFAAQDAIWLRDNLLVACVHGADHNPVG
jgi:hypothetical protein